MTEGQEASQTIDRMVYFLPKSHGNKSVKRSKEPFPFCILLLKTGDLFGRYVRGMGIEFVIINCELAGEFLN